MRSSVAVAGTPPMSSPTFPETASTGTVTPPPATVTAVGSRLTITGTSFGATQGSSTLEFGGGVLAGPVDIISWGDTEIVATVPATAQSGNVVVTVNDVPSEGYLLRIGLPPPEIVGLEQL